MEKGPTPNLETSDLALRLTACAEKAANISCSPFIIVVNTDESSFQASLWEDILKVVALCLDRHQSGLEQRRWSESPQFPPLAPSGFILGTSCKGSQAGGASVGILRVLHCSAGLPLLHQSACLPSFLEPPSQSLLDLSNSSSRCVQLSESPEFVVSAGAFLVVRGMKLVDQTGGNEVFI